MPSGQATLFRRAAARINYLGQDRPDLNVVSRLLAMKMAKPKRGDEEMIKRALRYLKGTPRLKYHYPWESGMGELTLYTDSDWGGDKEKRRSTSGVVILHGSHLIGHWSKLQNSPAPSSGEAELNACSKGLSEVLGIRHFLSQIGLEVKIRHCIDASAAKGTLLRKGAGKIKHLEVRQLWCQSAIERYGIEVIKIPRRLNLADCLTHGISKREQTLFHEAVGLQIESLEPSSARLTDTCSSHACSRILAVSRGSRGVGEVVSQYDTGSSMAGEVIWGPWGDTGFFYGVGGCYGGNRGPGSASPPHSDTRGAAFIFPTYFQNGESLS